MIKNNQFFIPNLHNAVDDPKIKIIQNLYHSHLKSKIVFHKHTMVHTIQWLKQKEKILSNIY